MNNCYIFFEAACSVPWNKKLKQSHVNQLLGLYIAIQKESSSPID